MKEIVKPAARFSILSKNCGALSRLAPALDAEARDGLRRALLLHQLLLCADYCDCRGYWAEGEGACPITLWSTPAREGDAAILAVLSALGIRERLQPEGHLGERMSAALNGDNRLPAAARLILGIDAVELSVAHIDGCLEALASKSWAFTPTRDGGFIMAGHSPAATGGRRAIPPDIAFSGERWSHAAALAAVLERLDPEDYALTEPISDIDSPEDLRRVVANGALWRAIHRVMRFLLKLGDGASPQDILRGLREEDGAFPFAAGREADWLTPWGDWGELRKALCSFQGHRR